MLTLKHRGYSPSGIIIAKSTYSPVLLYEHPSIKFSLSSALQVNFLFIMNFL